MNYICDKLIELFDVVVSFVKTLFSVDAQENYGRLQNTEGQRANAPEASIVGGDHGTVYIITGNLAWQSKINTAKAKKKVMVVDFFATWCSPCKMMAPIFGELSNKMSKRLMFAKVDIDEVPDVAAEYGVVSMPTFMFIRDGQEIDRIVGADKIALESKCNQYAIS